MCFTIGDLSPFFLMKDPGLLMPLSNPLTILSPVSTKPLLLSAICLMFHSGVGIQHPSRSFLAPSYSNDSGAKASFQASSQTR